MKKILAALVSGLCIQASAFAEQCVVDRYQINGSQLAENDVVELNVDGNIAAVTLTTDNSAADKWPAVLGRRVNSVISASVASSGTQAKLNELERYIPQNSATNNLLDVMQMGANVSLTLNGSDFSSALAAQPASQSSSGTALLPSWNQKFISSVAYNFINLSNVTDEQINVKIKLYQQNGTLYTESSEAGTQFISNSNNTVNATLALTPTGLDLPARQTISLYIPSVGAAKYGYGVVEWTADACLESAMSGVVIRYFGGSSYAGESQIALNGGQAF